MIYILITLAAILAVLFYKYVSLLKQRKDFDSFIEQRVKAEQELETEIYDKQVQLDRLQYQLIAEKNSKPNLDNFINKETYEGLYNEYQQTTEELEVLKEKHSEFVSKRKSQEVRLGAIAETLTPFLEGFPYNPKSLRSLGSPIDYVAFEENEIVFIEVKSGDSKTSKKQRDIKKLVDEGKVRFEVHRINQDGLKIE